jgi:glutamate--cysteine ligase
MREPESAPSARVLHAMARNHNDVYVRFVLAMSLLHQGTLKNGAFSKEAERYLVRLAEKSLVEQKQIEASDNVDFETYRARYLSPDLLKL